MDVKSLRDSLQSDAHKDTTTRRDFVKTGATLASGLAIGVYMKPMMQSAHLAVIANPSFGGDPPLGGDPPVPPGRVNPPPGPPNPPPGPPNPPKPGR